MEEEFGACSVHNQLRALIFAFISTSPHLPRNTAYTHAATDLTLLVLTEASTT